MGRLRRAIIPVVMAVSMISSLFITGSAFGETFTDIGQSYAKTQILDLYQRQIVNGTGKHLFEPKQTMTRAEFTAMLDRTIHIEPVVDAGAPFTDIPGSSWSAGWIEAAWNIGVIHGVSDNQFAPGEAISRQQAAVMIMQALKQSTASVPQGSLSVYYKDADQIATWAESDVYEAYMLDLMHGSRGRFRPHDAITRQEAAVIFDHIARHIDTSSPVRVSSTSPALQKIQLGWQYGQSTAAFEQEILNSTVNTISPRWYFLKNDGSFSDSTDSSLTNWAHQHGLKVWPLLGNGFDTARTHQFLNNPAEVSAAVQQISNFVSTYQLDGINLDFENIAAGDKSAFSRFVADLSTSLHQQSALLSVDVPPDLGTDWSAPYDYADLGKSADYIVMMTYDEHWTGDQDAGPVASIPWFNEKLTNMLSVVPSAKIIAGLPLYNRDWSVDSGHTVSTDITLSHQNKLLAQQTSTLQWEPSTQAYKLMYVLNGIPHEVWIENNRTLSLKSVRTLNSGAAGIAFWYMGSEEDSIWTSVTNAERFQQLHY